jgi:fucose permease
MQSAGRFEFSRLRMPATSPAASFTWFAYGLFVVLGVVTTLLGLVLPLLTIRWSITSAEAGSLFFWQFVPSTIGTLLSGAVFSKRSFRVAVISGVALCLIGVAVLLLADWTLGRFAIACYGFGLGISLPAINLAVAEANSERRAGSVSLLNFAWGIGAISGPILLRLAHNLDIFLTLLSSLILIGLVVSSVCSMPEKQSGTQRDTTSPLNRNLWTLVPMIAFSMFLFCGIENAIAGWASTLALPQFANAFTATNANIAFWTFFLAGRAIVPSALRRISEARLMMISIVLGAFGVAAFFFASHAITILLACALAGAGIGPGFPLLISYVSERIGSEHPACTMCFAFGGFGAATLPALVGVLGASLSHPRAGLALPLAGLLLLLPLTKAIAEKETSLSMAG